MVEFQFHIRVFPSAEHRFFQIADDQNPMNSTITNLTEIPEERAKRHLQSNRSRRQFAGIQNNNLENRPV
jgi:hypothetical protein